jgi:peptidoglycan hydrolase FlgJ
MTVNAADAARLSADPGTLDAIKLQAKSDPEGAAKAAAQQFEALFLNMLLKSMRDTTSQNTLFDNEQTRLYQSMFDQQIAQTMAKRGIGLADVMVRQLINKSVATPAMDAVEGEQSSAPPEPTSSAVESLAPSQQSAPGNSAAAPRDFVNRVWPHAVAAAQVAGVAPHFIVAQAALESGWGRSEIRSADGTPSYNLFNIKAGRGWTGNVVEAATTEYVNGAPQKSVERFRAYGSYVEAFADYARLLRTQPRYAAVVDSGGDARGFARGLQQAGYATDPMYADKLVRIINGGAMRQALTG